MNLEGAAPSARGGGWEDHICIRPHPHPAPTARRPAKNSRARRRSRLSSRAARRGRAYASSAAKAGRRRSHIASRCSGMQRTSPISGMKLVSPTQRGTMCQCRCSVMPAPAALPEVHADVHALGMKLLLQQGRPSGAASRPSSTCSSAGSADSSAVCRRGATMMWPLPYGKRFSITSRVRRARRAPAPPSGRARRGLSQKMQPASFGAPMYAMRHGAQRTSMSATVPAPSRLVIVVRGRRRRSAIGHQRPATND